MSRRNPKVSIVIPTYQPGHGLQRVMDSLDAQTMPSDEFEVIFVDDGSADDTFVRLQQLAADRPNVQAFRIDNSGWPSRPRNIGLDHASGEYVLFMDHDDSLFPDGLRRAHEYAVETDADLVSPKESKTNDRWWGMASLRDGNRANVARGPGIEAIGPLVPHKFYRRSMMVQHRIRFPEGPRMLWEDQFINVDAFRHARVVSVLADTPVYLWHGSDTNSSLTFDPARTDFWDRLDDLLGHVTKTLRPRQFRDSRRALVALHLRVRVIDALTRLLATQESEASEMALARARRLLRRYGSRDAISALPRKHQIHAALLRRGQRDLLVAVRQYDRSAAVTSRVTAMKWSAGTLHLSLETILAPQDSASPLLHRAGGRVLLTVPPEVASTCRSTLLDVTDAVGSMTIAPVIRSRRGHVTWAVPVAPAASSELVERPTGLGIRLRNTVTVDVRSAAAGRALSDNVWDLSVEVDWQGIWRRLAVSFRGACLPGLVDGRPVIPYANDSKGLSIDLAGGLRTLTSDAAPVAGDVGTVSDLSVTLTNLAHDGEQRLEVTNLVAVPTSDPHADSALVTPEELTGVATRFIGAVMADVAGTRLCGHLDVAPGSYRLFAERGGKARRTKHSLVVADDQWVEWVIGG